MKKPKKVSSASRVRLNLKERAAYRFLHLAGQVMRSLAEMYGPRYGLTIGTWKVLSMIGAYGPMSASELGKHTSLEPDKVTRTVDNLVKRNLVVRREDPADRRRVILTLSAKGKMVNNSIEQVRCCIEVDFLSGLDDRELETLYCILDKLDCRADEIFTDKDAWRDSVARCARIEVLNSPPKKSVVRKKTAKLQAA